MGLCLTYHVNLKLSTRQTSHAMKEIHGINISHTMVAHYAMTAVAVIKPFIDTFDYKPSNILSADETYTNERASTTISGLSWMPVKNLFSAIKYLITVL